MWEQALEATVACAAEQLPHIFALILPVCGIAKLTKAEEIAMVLDPFRHRPRPSNSCTEQNPTDASTSSADPTMRFNIESASDFLKSPLYICDPAAHPCLHARLALHAPDGSSSS
jgi:hypothetical protein